MIKAQLLFIIAITSGFLLTIQLISLQHIVTKGKNELNAVWSLLQVVSNESLVHNIPLFIIDSLILSNLNNFSNEYTYCRVLCRGQKVTTFATFGHFATYLQLSKVISSLRKRRFTVIENSDFDPTLTHLNIRVSQPLHLIVFDEKDSNNTAVHIVILYERLSSKFWWRGPLSLTDFEKRILHRRGIRRADINDEASIYEKVEVKLAVVDGLILGVPTDKRPFLLPASSIKFIECNKTQAKQFYNENPRDESDKAVVFRTKATNLLRKVKAILDKLEIPFWLSSGTCLGYFRECDWISYTQDVDIGIAIKDYKPSLIDAFSINNLPLLHVFGKPEDSFELSFRDGYLKLDIFFFYEESDVMWNGGTQARTG
ncbi:fukutin-like protein, partial [Leptotrombidium deliense]